VTRDAVLLEQRPPAGIWGSLLAPPQFASAKSLRSALAQLATASKVQALGARAATDSPLHADVHAVSGAHRCAAPARQRAESTLDFAGRYRLSGAAAPMRALLLDVRVLLAHEHPRPT